MVKNGTPVWTNAGADSFWTLAGGTDFFSLADHPDFDVAAAGSMTCAILLDPDSHTANQRFFAKRASLSTGSVGWGLRGISGSVVFEISDGTTEIAVSRSGLIADSVQLLVGRRNVATDKIVSNIDTTETEATDTTSLTLENAIAVFLGDDEQGGFTMNGDIYAAAFWGRTITDAEIAGLEAEFLEEAVGGSGSEMMLLGVG